MTTKQKTPVLGIDLGTTNSLVAITDETGPRIILDAEHNPLLPSVVRYAQPDPDSPPRPEAVGKPARDQAIKHPERTIASAKRLMGRSRDDAIRDLPHLPYTVVEGPNNTARIQLAHGQTVSPQEVSAAILTALRDRATQALNAEVNRAVITVPAYFDDAQRQATRDAARIAGIDALRIVNEPTAAALAYGIGINDQRDPTKPETVAVFDLGGGTFDFSILRVTPPQPTHQSPQGNAPETTAFFEVIATAGDTHLGGDDVDQLLASIVLDALAEQLTTKPELSPRDRQALRAMTEAAKIALSTEEQTTLAIDLHTADAEPISWSRTITRDEFNNLITPWLDRAFQCCKTALRDARLTPQNIDRLIMVGGSTRIPLVQQRAAREFDTIPYTAIDPDHVVALGAAVQASIIAGTTRGMLLLDVVPLSLGIETVGGAVAKIINKNTAIPARATEMFSTSVDNQTAIKLNILQGEREMTEHCRSLGIFELKGIPPMPAGMPQVEVEFYVDANAILNVNAHERRSGKRATLQVVPNHGLTADEIERIEAESFAHAREDMTRHRIVDLIANAKLDAKWINERLNAIAHLLEPDYKDQLTNAVDQLRALIAAAEADWRAVDPNAFHKAKEDLDRLSVRMHEISIANSLSSDADQPNA